MKSFAHWLTEIGLERYAAVFSENKVDFDVLRSLTESDLRELGVALGDRKRILQAVAKLDGQAAVEVAPAPKASEAAAPPLSAATSETSTGERRQLTVMFCDLVGSTALSEKLDPEELRSLLHNYRTVCGEVISRYEGFVARYVGDGILTYFGWPKAHEEDAERALRAALEIIQTVKSASVTEALSVRIGIATGPVVVGEQAGVGEQSKLAIGSTPNLAARLQGLASADQIVVASSTRRLVGNAFELADLGEHELKGIAEPVHAWRVVAVGAAASRFDAATQGAMTPMVGREQELGLLLDRWQQAQEGEGQVVLLSGEPGIGKSRVMSTLRERLEDQGAQALRFQCSPYHINSAFYPSIDNFERALKFNRDETPDAKLDKLEALIVTHFGRPLTNVRFIASILSIPYESRYGELPMTPQKFKDETLRTLVDLSEASARKQPTVMLFEDAHWADPTSLEVLDLLIDRVKTFPLLIVLTHRPEFQPKWDSHGHVTALNLSKLTRAQSGAIVDKLIQSRELPAGLLDQILNKTDGVPLYVEELTKSILESGELKAVGNHYDYAGAARSVTIPATLRDSLMARLDRFAPVKEIAQIGAAIGREFSYELIVAVAPHSKANLDSALNQLTESGLAFRRGTPPEATYTFKHALVQDTAYDSLLKTRRRALHAKIARVLEEHFPTTKDTEPELLAHHLTLAELGERAVPYWIAASRRSVERFANTEAIGYVGRGMGTLEALPAGTARDQKELLLQVNLGTALGSSKGFTPPEVGQTFARARDLCERVGQTPQMLCILYGLWVYYLMGGDYDTSRELDNQILDLARRTDDASGMIAGHQTSCGTALFCGEFESAVEHGDVGWSYYNEKDHKHLGPVYSLNPATVCHDFSSWALVSLGFLDRAADRHAWAVRLAMDQGHLLTIATVKTHAACIHYIRDDVKSTLEVTREVIAMCKESGILIRKAECEMLEGWALAEMGETERAIPQIEAALNLWNLIGAQAANPMWYGCLSRAYQKAGRMDEARSALQKGMEYGEKNREGLVEAEMHRLDGELRVAMGHGDSVAESCLLKAIQVAKAQKAKLFELRASMSLTKFWRSQGKRKEAHDLLTQVYAWFTEGFDTKDLIEAKALLDELV